MNMKGIPVEQLTIKRKLANQINILHEHVGTVGLQVVREQP